jgi:hypothetical protein
LIDFSTDVNSFRDGFVAATPENIREARRYLDGLRAEGSTNISGALEEALNARSDGERLPLIVFPDRRRADGPVSAIPKPSPRLHLVAGVTRACSRLASAPT